MHDANHKNERESVVALARFGENIHWGDYAFCIKQAQINRLPLQICISISYTSCAHTPQPSSPKATNKSSEKCLNYMAIFNSCIFMSKDDLLPRHALLASRTKYIYYICTYRVHLCSALADKPSAFAAHQNHVPSFAENLLG